MRVLFVSHTSEISGAEQSLVSLVQSLPRHVHPIVACPPGDLAEYLRNQGITVRRVGGVDGGPRVGLAAARAVLSTLADAQRVRLMCRQYGTDIVHANSLRSAVTSCLASQFGGPPVVAHVRDCFPSGELVTRVARAFVSRFAAAVVFNSEHTQRCFRSGIGRATGQAPWFVIPNGVDIETFKPDSGRARSRCALGVDHRDIVLGVIGQVSPWKAQDDAVRVLATLCDGGYDAHLLIVGSAKFVKREGRFDHLAYAASLRDLVRTLGLEEHVSWLGERRDVPQVLEAIDVVLLPSWQEPFGRTVIEAMAMETPVLATNVGGPSEIICDGREGILLPPRAVQVWAEALGRLLRDPEIMVAMGRRGRQRVLERFDARHHATRVLAVYEQMGRRSDGPATNRAPVSRLGGRRI